MTEALTRYETRLLPSVWKLLRIRLLITFSNFKRGKLRNKIGTIVLWLFFAALMAGAFIGSWYLLQFIQSEEFIAMVGDPEPILRSIPTLMISGSIIMIFMTSFGVLLQALYLSGDMEFLLAAPIPIRAVFLSKLVQAILPNFGLASLFTLPVIFGLGAAHGYHFLFYPLAIILMALLALAAAALSSLLVMLLARFVSPRRIAEIMAFVVGISSFVCSQSGQFINTMQPDMTDAQVTQTFQSLTRFNTPWSPLAWAGQGLVNIGEGNWLAGGGYLLLILVLGVAIFAVALVTAERLYYSGWARVSVSWKKKKAPAKARKDNGVAKAAGRWIPAPIRAMVVKDFLLMRRDLRNLSQLMTPLILGIVYALSLLRTGSIAPEGQGNAPGWFMDALQAGFNFGDIAISLFVGWILVMRLAGMSFSQEGKSYWMLKSAPLNPGQLLTAKFLVAWVPSVLVGWLFVIVMAILQPARLATLPFAMLVIAFCFAGLTGINLAFGVTGAKFDWVDPRKMQGGNAGCLGSILSTVFLPISAALLVGPAALLPVFGIPPIAGQIAGLLVGGGLCVACVVIPLNAVKEKVARLNEA